MKLRNLHRHDNTPTQKRVDVSLRVTSMDSVLCRDFMQGGHKRSLHNTTYRKLVCRRSIGTGAVRNHARLSRAREGSHFNRGTCRTTQTGRPS